MNLEEIKTKVAEIKQKETELNILKQTLSILQPLYFEASQSVQEKVSSNSIGLIQQSVNEVTDAIKNKLDYTEIVNKLDRQIAILEDSKDIEIMNELKSLVTNIKDLSTISTFNNEAFVRIFNESLNKISNLLISQKELPNITEFADIDMTGDALSTILLCRLFRNSSNAADSFTGSAMLLYIDCHVEMSQLGSKDEYQQ